MEGSSFLRRLQLIVGAIFLLAMGSFLAVYGYTRHTARNAGTLLADFQRLRLNASQADADRFVAAHAGSGTKETKCADPQGTNCELVIRLDNRWLAKLHLAPPSDFAVGFTCSRGRISGMEASIGVHRVIPGTFTTIYAAEVTEQLSDPELGPFQSTHKLAHNAPGVFIPWFVNEKLDERATETQRKSAYSSLNLSCLYKIGGCKDAEALAPSAWTATDKAGWHDETPSPESR